MLVDRVDAALRRCGAIRPGDSLVVGVSGGPDSLALLDILHRLSGSLRIQLHVAHLDHTLRPDSADDALFVAEFARRLGLPATLEDTDVGRIAAESRLGVEEAARLARFAFFGRVVSATASSCVVLGHTADDQVETIVLSLVRGSGPTGLRGMRPVSVRRIPGGSSSLTVVRPLLDVSREEIEAYLKGRGIEPRRDPTNADSSFRRNRVRHEVLPALRALNPRFDSAIIRLGRLVDADERDFEGRLEALWPSLAEETSDCVRLRRDALAKLSASLAGRAARRAYVGVVGDALELEAGHVGSARELVVGGRTGDQIDWPRGVRVWLDYDWLVVERKRALRDDELLPAAGILLTVPGTTYLPTGAQLVARLTTDARRCEDTGHDHADLDFDLAGRVLSARRRRPGDRLVPFGTLGEKKVQDLLVDAKVPRSERDCVPIVEGVGGIVWVAGVRADRRYAVGPGTRTVVCLRLLKKKKDTSQR